MIDCSFKKYLGVDCLGCGFQRSFQLLLEGQFIESIKMFPALLPLLITIIYLILHLKFKFNSGARTIVILFSLSAALMIANFIIKLI